MTPVDVIARRTRLAFLNARSTLDALPHIVDIMAEELGWSYSERQRQIAATVKFLGTMGLPPAFMAATNVPEPLPRGWREQVTAAIWRAGAGLLNWRNPIIEHVENGPGRSKFEAGEVVALRNAFNGRAVLSADGSEKVKTADVLDILKAMPGFSEVTRKELDYVLDEAGLREQSELDSDEFIEVRLCVLLPDGS